ncbi:hypothetical protein CJ030_MR7G011674 [Morella rubra]|uniref:TF-B3 domain-containing protein n=1 Tax=Morella rubra TaxID=262757 RepID=A0A6A1V0M7_9ROSI|nr:hypothetical protein CJ030_MR7G011674 [Morella rubra]
MAAIACPMCGLETVEFREAFKKRLSREDIQGSHGVYIPLNDVAKLSERRLANENEVNLLFYDVQNNPWEMRLHQSPQGKHFLTGGWRQFVRVKNLITEGGTVTFYALRCPGCMENTGYTIGVLKLLGKPIIV